MNSYKRWSQVVSGFALILLLFSSCGIFKPGGSSGKGLYETFYVGEGAVQYFVKPLEFDADNGELTMDFTIHSEKDSATINLSIWHETPLKSLESLTISNGEHEMTTTAIQGIFVELDDKYYHSRLSAQAPVENLKKVFTENNWFVTLEAKGNEYIYEATRKTKKKIEPLNKAVLQLVD